MGPKLKSILMSVLAIVVIVLLLRFAWALAGFVIRIMLTLLIFAILAGLVWYIYNQFRKR
ncbi:hypothetical protein LJB76_02200 [Clostridia bacterium OttesenSCG-928-O13]|nr:hypothetical protein [Clostridia bacterium OttesenSCG-928-O13]